MQNYDWSKMKFSVTRRMRVCLKCRVRRDNGRRSFHWFKVGSISINLSKTEVAGKMPVAYLHTRHYQAYPKINNPLFIRTKRHIIFCTKAISPDGRILVCLFFHFVWYVFFSFFSVRHSLAIILR